MQKKTWYILIGILAAILLAGVVFIAVMLKHGQAPTGEVPTVTSSQQIQGEENEPTAAGDNTPTSGNETQKPEKENVPEGGGKESEKETTKATMPPAPTNSGKQDRYETPRDYS